MMTPTIEPVTDEKGFLKGFRIISNKESPVGIFMAGDFPVMGNELTFQCISKEMKDSEVELEFCLQEYRPDRIMGTWCLDLSGEGCNSTEEFIDGIRRNIESAKKAHGLHN